MTTEHGLPRLKEIRACINILRDRMEYLEDKQAERIDERLNASHWISQEIRAISFALPVLEAEYDSVLRLRKLIMDEEGLDIAKYGLDSGLFALRRHEGASNG